MSFVLFLFLSQSRLSFVSVLFDFNASPNDVAPVSPIKLSVDLMRICRNELLHFIFVLFFFLFTTQIKFSECCVGFQCIAQ